MAMIRAKMRHAVWADWGDWRLGPRIGARFPSRRGAHVRRRTGRPTFTGPYSRTVTPRRSGRPGIGRRVAEKRLAISLVDVTDLEHVRYAGLNAREMMYA